MSDGSDFGGPVSLKAAKIKEDLDWSDGIFRDNVDMSGAQVGRKFVLSGREVWTSASFSDFVFGGAEWGDDPVVVLKNLTAVTPTSEYNPGFYDRLAKSYGDLGRSGVVRSVLIEKQNAEFRHAGSLWEKVYLFVTWALVGYGYRPEIGFLWIGVFVAAGAIIFKTGEDDVVSETVPDNWLVFAVDSVVPGIHLNPEYDNVEFSGWRQNFLYFMRFLGAVLIVLVLQFMKQSILGPH